MNANSHDKHTSISLFLSTAFLFFFLAYSAADSVGFVPYYMDGTAPRAETLALSELPQLGEEQAQIVPETPAPVAPVTVAHEVVVNPTRLRISKINMDVPVLNTQSRDAGVLDEALKKAPVRYMDSAKLGEDGNVLIFAHSSHLPIVHNQMFKIFNRLPELNKGDSIVLTGDGEEYIYHVTSVHKTDATDGIIDLSKNNGRRLTLSTCDNFGAKTSRWVVEAEFVGKSE